MGLGLKLSLIVCFLGASVGPAGGGMVFFAESGKGFRPSGRGFRIGAAPGSGVADFLTNADA